MHVQRHSFKVTFTLRSVVKSIKRHITGRSKVEILLMLTEGHTSYTQNMHISSTGDKADHMARVKTTKQLFFKLKKYFSMKHEQHFKKQKRKLQSRDQLLLKVKESYFFTSNSFYTKELYSSHFWSICFIYCGQKTSLI